MTQIRASQIRASQIRASQIRATEISSNHRELHGAIFLYSQLQKRLPCLQSLQWMMSLWDSLSHLGLRLHSSHPDNSAHRIIHFRLEKAMVKTYGNGTIDKDSLTLFTQCHVRLTNDPKFVAFAEEGYVVSFCGEGNFSMEVNVYKTNSGENKVYIICASLSSEFTFGLKSEICGKNNLAYHHIFVIKDMVHYQPCYFSHMEPLDARVHCHFSWTEGKQKCFNLTSVLPFFVDRASFLQFAQILKIRFDMVQAIFIGLQRSNQVSSFQTGFCSPAPNQS